MKQLKLEQKKLKEEIRMLSKKEEKIIETRSMSAVEEQRAKYLAKKKGKRFDEQEVCLRMQVVEISHYF